jgi:hypothetical protein
MKDFIHILICTFLAVTFIVACEPKPTDVTMTFSRDTVINGVKTEEILKTGHVRQLTRIQRDSINEMVIHAEILTERYLSREVHEDTIVYLDKLIAHLKGDSLVDRMTLDQISHAIAIQFGQAMVENNNFEWKLFEKELMIEEKQGFEAKFPYEIAKAILYQQDTADLYETRLTIIRHVKIFKQMEDLRAK